jgi:hypothetical protein
MFPAKCEHCGVKLVRPHDFTKSLLTGYSAFAFIPLVVVLFLFIEQAFFIIAILIGLPFFVYLVEVSRNELEVFTNDDQDKYKSRSRKHLILLAVFVSIMFVVGYFSL